MPRQITDSEKEYLLSLKQDDITLDLLKELFADTKSRKRKFQFNDTMYLTVNEYFNDKVINTTVGRFIVNKVILEPNIIKHLGYQDVVLDGGGLSKLDGKVVNLIIGGKIKIEDLHYYFDQCNWLGYAPTYFVVPSLDTELFIIPENVKAKKKELMDKYSEEIKNNEVNVITTEIEKTLLDMAKQEIKDVPGYQIYESGARGSFNNNYKNSVIMRGGIMDFTDPSNFNVSMSSLVDGIEKEDFDKFANILIAGTYSRSNNTEKGGYVGKQLHSAFQHLMLGEKDSDCGTKKFLEVEITDTIKALYYYRYIQEGGKLVLITPENIDKYIGKTVKMRSPIYCTSDHYCNKCAGELYYILGIKHVGLLTNKQGTSLMQYAMKLFHNSAIKMATLDYKKYLKKIK